MVETDTCVKLVYKSTEQTRKRAAKWYLEHRVEVLRKHKENSRNIGPKKKKMTYRYPESRRINNLKPTGWTPERMDAALVTQGNRCAICEEVFTATPHCDHKHVLPPEPRALLCGNCNRALGLLKDNPERCESAAKYLRSWS